MADNTQLSTATGTGDVLATKEVSHGGDTVKLQSVSIVGVSGSEGSYTIADINGDAANGLDVDVTRSALPTGAATSAKQDTIIGHLDGVEGLLTTIDGDTGTLAGAVSGTEMQVDIVASLPAGANAIGKLAANSGVDIGDVDVTSLTPGTGATNAGKAEDAAHASGDVGVLALAVRRDTAAVGSDTDGDYSTLNVDANGRLHVNVGNTVTVAAHAVTNAGTFAVQVDGAALTALQLIDDPVLTDDAAFTPATSKVTMAGFQADESSTDSIDEGDAGAARMSLDRKQYVIAHNETSTIYQNGTARTPAFAVIDAATSGDNTLLAAQGAGNKIRVHQLFLVSAGTVNVRFESGTGGTALTGQMNLVANTGFVLPYSPIGWFETAANTLLNLELSAAISVDGNFAYTVVT